MSSSLDNDFSILVADLLRNELFSQSQPIRTTTDNQTMNDGQTLPSRRMIYDVISEYNGIMGHYNRNMEMLLGLLNEEITNTRPVTARDSTRYNASAAPRPRTVTPEIETPEIEPQEQDNTIPTTTTTTPNTRTNVPQTSQQSPYRIVPEVSRQYDMSGNTSIDSAFRSENPYASLLSLSNLSRIWGRPRHTSNLLSNGLSNITRDYMLYINTTPIYSQETEQAVGLTDEEIESATVEVVYNTSADMISTQCPISFDDFRNGENILRIRECGHIFKPVELRRWLTRHHNCPVCRYDLRTNIRHQMNADTFNDYETESDDYSDLPDLTNTSDHSDAYSTV